ncbi:hypothetical protein VPH35_073297 [Triticum aestivum]
MLLFFYWATPPMVKIPYRMVLDVLLESLGLPVAEYRTKACDLFEVQHHPTPFGPSRPVLPHHRRKTGAAYLPATPKGCATQSAE